MVAASAKAEERLARVCVFGNWNRFESRVSNHNYPVLSFRTLESNVEV